VITPPDSAPQRPEQMPESTFDIMAPYAPGVPSAIFVGGGADPGGRDDVAGTVAAAQAAAEARFREHQSDTYGQGSTIGDLIALPDVVSDHSLTTGGDGAGHPFEEDS
jgi:hypothetical protein